MHHVLSGPINSGKSTRLMGEVERLIAEGKRVSGFVCMPLMVDSRWSMAEKEYDIVFITMNKIHEPRRFIRSEPFENSFAWRRFYFDKTVFNHAATMDFGKPDIFVIDEVGPLELEDRKGFWKVLPDSYSRHKETVTVVREGCVEKFKRSFPEHTYLVQSIQG